MRKTFKKAVSLLCVFAMMASFAVAPSFAEITGANIAAEATVTSNFVNPQEGTPDRINDGIANNWYKGNTTHDQEGDAREHGEWNIYMKWDSPQTFNAVRIYYESCRAIGFTLRTSTDGENWDTVIYEETNNQRDQWYEATFESVTSQYLALFINHKANTWGVGVGEIEVYDPNVENYETALLNDAVTKADKLGATNNFGYTETTWNAYTTAAADAKAVLQACEGKALNSVQGYTQETIDTALSTLAIALSNLDVVASKDNVLYNGIMHYDAGNLTSYCGGINFRSLTDGAWEENNNNWQPDNNRSQGATAYIALITPAALNKLVMYAESEGYSMNIFYTTDSISGVYGMDAYAALNWTALCGTGDETFKYSYKLENDGLLTAYSFGFDAVENVTAIKIVNNNGGWFKLREVEAYNEALGANTLDNPTEFANSTGTEKFFAAAVDSSFEGKTIVAQYTIKVDGNVKVNKKQVYLLNAYRAIQLGDIKVTGDRLNGGHTGDYVTGIYFTDIPANATVEVEFIVK